MRVCFVNSSLSAGGAERVMSVMANHWAAQGWDVTLFSLDAGESYYDLHPNVQHRPLGLYAESGNAVWGVINNVSRVRVLRRSIRRAKPDVVISFLTTTNIRTILATRLMRIPVIVSEHNDPTMDARGRIWSVLRRVMYPWASAVTVLTPSIRDMFPNNLRHRLVVMPNPVSDPGERAYQIDAEGPPLIIAVGSLSEQKGFDILLQAFATIRHRHPDWRVLVLGEGPERQRLEKLREDLDLSGIVELPGRTREVQKALRRASLFVMPSRYEGFPMALCEAMAIGLPVVCTRWPAGPEFIVRDGVDGILVPAGDVEALADAMATLMASRAKRLRLAARAPEVLARFGVNQVMGQWEHLIASLVAHGAPAQSPARTLRGGE